jgi:hypothetical protein
MQSDGGLSSGELCCWVVAEPLPYGIIMSRIYLHPAATLLEVCRIYIPLPNEEGRAAIMSHLLKGSNHGLSLRDFEGVVRATEGYSASDLTALCKSPAPVEAYQTGPCSWLLGGMGGS